MECSHLISPAGNPPPSGNPFAGDGFPAGISRPSCVSIGAHAEGAECWEASGVVGVRRLIAEPTTALVKRKPQNIAAGEKIRAKFESDHFPRPLGPTGVKRQPTSESAPPAVFRLQTQQKRENGRKHSRRVAKRRRFCRCLEFDSTIIGCSC